ncbi:MAG: hypothetical protein OXN84_17390, partial [Albidovulum sp.]|nr:hypothetical protein [Albidovulum sp.]
LNILAAHWIFPSRLADPAVTVALDFGTPSCCVVFSSAPALIVCQLAGAVVAVVLACALDAENSETGTVGKRALTNGIWCLA